MVKPKRYISCSGKPKIPSVYNHARPEQVFDKIWKDHSAVLISWFSKALSRGIPQSALSEPPCIESLDCECTKKQTKVIVFMNHNVCQIDVEHCHCRGLLETLIPRQVLPSSSKNPKNGCYFAFLNFARIVIKHTKMSNPAFTHITNQHYSRENNGLGEISEDILSTSLQNYRKLMRQVEERTETGCGANE